MNKRKIIGLLAFLGVAFSKPAIAVDGVYLGGVLGVAGFTGAASDTALGFGVDLGFKTSSNIDVMFHFQTSSHTGATLYVPYLTAEIHYLEASDFDFTLGVGPGMYFIKNPIATASEFGINFGTAADLKVDDAIRLGLGFRYHIIMDSAAANFWSFLFRFGYHFEL